jgi:N-acetylneuraminate synthase/N,N'-diacetyllegionaminate synthase
LKKKVIIIAEAGVNHNGELNKALELVKIAAEAGADYVKFQTFKADLLVSKTALKAEYQKTTLDNGENTQYEMLKKLEIPYEWHFKLMEYSKTLGIKFLSTGFDNETIDFLDDLGIEVFKVPSGEITNYTYLKNIASKNKPVILSTGMAEMYEINDAIELLKCNGVDKNDITVLHCNTAYPTEMSDVNLLAMKDIADNFNVKIGYSDHTLGIEVPIAAAALGATIIEKHFTIDKQLPGPDHQASLDPDELKLMVRLIRNTEIATSGSGLKIPSERELVNRSIVRKSIHLSFALKAGHIIQLEDLIMKRPGDGISPMLINSIIGKKVKYDLPIEHMLSINDFE